MGWWSTVVMGGDTPLDYQGDMIELCGVDYSTFMDVHDLNLTAIRSEIESSLNKLSEYCEKEYSNDDCYGDPNIAYQVFGVMILEAGATLPEDIKIKIDTAAKNDEWSTEDDERKANMDVFRLQVANYDGTPTTIKYQGLFEQINVDLN